MAEASRRRDLGFVIVVAVVGFLGLVVVAAAGALYLLLSAKPAPPTKPADPRASYDAGFDGATWPNAPLGKAKRTTCLRDDLSRIPYPTSPFSGDIDPAATGAAVDHFNDLCGDVWCEGSFEIAFVDLACDTKRKTCDLEMRFYTTLRVQPVGDATKVAASGTGWNGQVLAQSQVEHCYPPGVKIGLEWRRPCGVIDVRCELWPKNGVQHAKFPDDDFHDLTSECIKAIEKNIRAVIPEFPPRPK